MLLSMCSVHIQVKANSHLTENLPVLWLILHQLTRRRPRWSSDRLQ